MSTPLSRPDLVVSIDFGMTCTGVAYCNIATGNDRIFHIQRWPGRTMANENKVPTLLLYPRGSTTPSSWGFLAETAQEQGNPGDDSKEWFKILLDEELLEQMRSSAPDPSKVPTMAEVEKWYCDYFQFLYRCIEARLRGELASRWEDAKIEFIFSVPTTWKPVPTVERFRNITTRAGFGASPNHISSIGLTEAEAAAVHTARDQPAIFRENDILFVCDVGGGTTDLSAFRVKNTNNFGGPLSLEQIDVVFGANVGAAQLDSLFENAMVERLQAADRIIPMGLEDLGLAAWDMRISSEYQNVKCDYGSEDSKMDTEIVRLRVPKLDRGYSNPQCGIDRGELLLRRDDLKPFFDAQVGKLFEMLDKQLVRLQQRFPNEQAAHMVLSGGLGNSAYVRDCLVSRYANGNAPHPNARNLQIRVAPDPQLVVCRGNVADRVQKLKSGQSILGWRCSRSSYGTLCKVLYDPQNTAHFGLKTEQDPMDGKLYVVDSIDWFIKQGQPVSSDFPVVRNFRRKCPPASAFNPNPPRIFPTEIVCSDVDASLLPMVMNNSCRSICKVQSDFSTLPLTLFKLKNRHWWNSGAKYHRIDYCVKVNIGPADICFELWHQGVKLSKDETIKVEWHASAPPPPPPPSQNPMDAGYGMGNGLAVAQGPPPVGVPAGGMGGGMFGGYGKTPGVVTTQVGQGGYGNWGRGMA